MAKQSEVIEPRTHASTSIYRSWLRKIGHHTYRFKVSTRSSDDLLVWNIRVDVSHGGRNRGWETVHQWSNN